MVCMHSTTEQMVLSFLNFKCLSSEEFNTSPPTSHTLPSLGTSGLIKFHQEWPISIRSSVWASAAISFLLRVWYLFFGLFVCLFFEKLFSSSLFSGTIFFIFLLLRCRSWMQQNDGSCFHIHFVSLFLFIGGLIPLMLRNITGCYSVILMVVVLVYEFVFVYFPCFC